MASVFAKLGASGARMGGKMAAKQVGKKMGKQIAKKALKSSIKGLPEKGTKEDGKKAMKGAEKKTSKKLVKKTVKKSSKKTTKKASDSESELVSIEATPTVSPEASDEKREKRKEKAKGQEKGKAESTKSAGDHDKLKPKGSQSRRKKETPVFNIRSETTDTDENDSLADKQKNRNGKGIKKGGSKLEESKTKVTRQSKDNLKKMKKELFGRSTKSVSETTEEPSVQVPLIQSVSQNVTSEPMDSTELATSRTAITNEGTKEESSETPSINTGQAAPNSMTRRPTLSSREIRRPMSAGLPKFAARQSTSRPSINHSTTANLPGPLLDSLKQKQYEQLLKNGKRLPGTQALKDAVHRDLLTKEAAREVDDQEFNLMLFRLAKHLLMDSGSGKVEGGHKPRRKKRRRKSEWLQALSLIIRAQNESSAIRGMSVQHMTPSCHAVCHPCPCSVRDNTKTTSKPVVTQEDNGETANAGKIAATQGMQSEGGQVRRERVTEPSSSELLVSNESKISSGSHLTSSTEESSSSYSPKQFREETERICDVIRAVQNVPTLSPMQQCRRAHISCTCRHKSNSLTHSPNKVLKSETAAQPAIPQALNIAVPASDPTSFGSPTAFQQITRYCHGTQQVLPCVPTINTFCLTADDRPIAAVPYYVNLCDPMAMVLPIQPTCQDQFVITNIVDPNMVCIQDYYA
ncbi:uncharacterized protein DEA37_0012469 [Paragonimus westermani]|uniref:Uncharacterized protein n=1 Tax=Paragonimus westermani TaxID=34504 RepID=A0A5J4NVB6_9TREM|nr:uncharacterized protein DEA37_0012469 [Paragonimus westermani]